MSDGSSTGGEAATSRLSSAEWRRRFWHMAPGLLPFCLWPIPHADPISPTLRAIMIAVAAVIGGLIFFRYRRIERHAGDNQRLAAVAGYVLSVLGTLLLFPAHAEIGLAVLGVLAFGDGSATLGGLLLGGPRLPWNRSKTVSGLLCFIIVGGALSSVIYWGESHNLEAMHPPGPATWTTALACGLTASFVAAIAESIPSRINDNIRVGVSSAVALAALHFWLA